MREDWIECKIKDVGEITSGGTPSTSVSEYWDGDISWISPSDLTGYKEKFISKGKKSITLNGLNKSSARLIPAGSVLFSSRAPIGYVVIAKNELATNQGFKNVSPSKVVDTDFLYHFLKNSKQVAERVATGTTFKEISKDAFGKLTFLLPPLPEQRAIVKKLESLFSSLDAGVADLKKAQQQIKIYRQAVLKKAFEGITETIILNDAGAWKGGGTPSTQNKDFWENGNINWVSSQDVKTKYIEETERKITSIAIENSSTKWIEKNALLFVVRSGILRRIFPIAIAKVDLCVNQDIQTLTLNERYLTEFVYWYLMGNEYDIRHNCAKDGTTVESIDVSKLKKYKLPTCTLDEQKDIVKQIESRLSVCDSIEQNIKESLAKAEALRQSILKKAFEGNLLTAQELAECKQAADYEPASVLLQRIRKNA